MTPKTSTKSTFPDGAIEQLVGPERRERELIADFQLPIVDLIRADRSTLTLGIFRYLHRMTRRGFRKLIILWWLAGISCVVVSVATNDYLPIELKTYLEAVANAEPTFRDWIVIAIGFVVLIAAIVVTVGLYRFRPWAKKLLLPIHVIALLVMPFYGPSVMTGWASALSFLYSVLTGGLLFLIYLSPVSQMFLTQNDA